MEKMSNESRFKPDFVYISQPPSPKAKGYGVPGSRREHREKLLFWL